MSKLFERIEIPKIDLSGVDVMIKGVETELDRIAKDIVDRQDNAMAMEFTRVICEHLKLWGVTPKITEIKTAGTFDEGRNIIEQHYGCIIEGLDFTEHDKVFKDEITKSNEEISYLRNTVRDYQKELTEVGKKTADLPFDPLETANYLINLNYERETSSVERAIGRAEKITEDKYSIDDLEQIAEHLLVYCKHNREIE